MLSKEIKKRLLQMALTCLRTPGEMRPVFSPTIPTDKELAEIKEGLKTGDIDEELLAKFFPMAYKGITQNDFMEYYFTDHNRLIRGLPRYTDLGLVEWCTAHPARIVKSAGSRYEIELINGRRMITDSELYPGIIAYRRLKEGDPVIVHRDKINMKISEREYGRICGLYNKGVNFHSKI